MKRISIALVSFLLALPAWAGTPRASSELRDSEGNRYPVAYAFDGLLSTAWAEGEYGDGEGSWIELNLGTPTEIASISIWPGKLEGTNRNIRENGRPKKVTITLSGAGEDVVVEKVLRDPGEHGPLRVDIDVEGKARVVRIQIDEVYAGGIFADTYISEVAINFAKGPTPPVVQRTLAQLESPAGQKQIEANRAEVIALYDKIKGSEFGDRDALFALMDRAADGAPFLRRQVAASVPAGYRIAALPPDDVAVEALLKVKDSNAIPAIERAALRTVGSESARYQQYAGVFRAHQALVGGASVVVPPWGQTGFAKGALQGLGEPLQIEVDNFGGIWVADTANNRVQRFGMTGLAEKVWCEGEPLITSDWFQGTRAQYAAACAPSDRPNGFRNPVDLTVIPGKHHDTVAVLDAGGKVTIIGAGDAVERHWKLPVTDPIIAGVGGEGYIVHTKKKLVILWGNQGFVYSLTGDELGRFPIADGVPSGAVAFKNGKLGLIFGQELVLYGLDGFRHGGVLRGALGKGFESWDVTLDEEGKLWAVTDKGTLTKFKSPGKVEFTVQLDAFSLQVPRLDVYDGLAFITSRDTIRKVDALELHARQAVEAAE